jgi:hypothetical protein
MESQNMGISIPKIDESTDRGREGDIFVPAGLYYVKVLETSEEEKKDKSGSFIQAQYEIVDAKEEANENAIGLRIFDIFSTTPESLWKLAKWLDACYAPTKFEGAEIPNDIEDKEFVVRVAFEKYQGKENLRVKAYMDRFNWEGHTMRTDDEGNQIVESEPEAKPEPKAAAKTATKPTAKGGKQVSV